MDLLRSKVKLSMPVTYHVDDKEKAESIVAEVILCILYVQRGTREEGTEVER